jgi:hypothetical protein
VWPLWGYHVPAFDGEEPPDYTQIDNRVNETVCVLDNNDLYERIVPEGVIYHPPTPKTLGEQLSEMSNVWDRRIEPPDPRLYRIDLQAIRRFFEANSTLGRPPLAFKEERAGWALEEPQKWPWGDHETELLRAMAAAAKRFWYNYDPEQLDTAPKSEDVKTWLMDEHGVSDNLAQAIATILRPSGLRTGPR